jgi:hypothetical protein
MKAPQPRFDCILACHICGPRAKRFQRTATRRRVEIDTDVRPAVFAKSPAAAPTDDLSSCGSGATVDCWRALLCVIHRRLGRRWACRRIRDGNVESQYRDLFRHHLRQFADRLLRCLIRGAVRVMTSARAQCTGFVSGYGKCRFDLSTCDIDDSSDVPRAAFAGAGCGE